PQRWANIKKKVNDQQTNHGSSPYSYSPTQAIVDVAHPGGSPAFGDPNVTTVEPKINEMINSRINNLIKSGGLLGSPTTWDYQTTGQVNTGIVQNTPPALVVSQVTSTPKTTIYQINTLFGRSGGMGGSGSHTGAMGGH